MLLYEDHAGEGDRKGVVYALAFSPDGSALVSAGKDGDLYLREASGRRHSIIEREPNTLGIHSVVFVEEGSLLVGGAFGWLGYRRTSDDCWQLFGNPKAEIPTNALALLDDHTLAVGTGDRLKQKPGAFELWDLSSGRKRQPSFPEPSGVRALAVCPARRMVAWATADRKVRVWEIMKQNKPTDFPQQKECTSVAFHPAGGRLAIASDYGCKVYNLETRCERFELKGHRGIVSTVAFSPDGAIIATGSWDHSVKLWNAETGQEQLTFKWPIGRVCCLAFAPDGLRLAAGGDQGTVVVWDLE
jgi:WD40 repeat protein